MSRDFSFKQFTVKQEKAAFKVGTDSVVLGAWANIFSAKNILDIGTGTGLLALMCAQRNFAAQIVAIEKDALSAHEAQYNFEASVWNERLSAKNISLKNFQADIKFDYIICNPPYFLNALLSEDERKMNARHAAVDWFSILAQQVNFLSTNNGTFGCVLPAEEFEVLHKHLQQHGWNICRKQRLLAYPNGNKVRVLAEWKRGEQEPNELVDLFVRNEAREFSTEYITLSKDFYLKF